MIRRLANAYLILSKEYENSSLKTDISLDCKYIVSSQVGIGNCYLWGVGKINKYSRQILGYLEAAYFLYEKLLSTETSKRDGRQLMPILFLLRNCIELQLKALLHIRLDHGLENAENICKSHLLYKRLWRNLRPVLEYYGNVRCYDLSPLDVLEGHIKELSSIDKNGDTFRYPFSYNLEYRLDKQPIDIKKSVKWMLSMVDFLDGCVFMFEEISDYEGQK